MKEDFLQFIWKMQLFQPAQLRTVFDEKVKIFKPGFENKNAGPDFLNASIEVGGQLWAGHVEIHIKSSDWYMHLHQLDSNYNATILHVVWEYDVPVFSPGKTEIPAIELQKFVSENLLNQYKSLFEKGQKWIYCENLIHKVDSFKVEKYLEELYFERLEVKVEKLNQHLEKFKFDWEHLLFVSLAENFGLKINKNNFGEIAQSTPFHIFRKVSDSRLHLEALLFGQAGLLLNDVPKDAYFKTLQKEYEFLKKKYALSSPLVCKVHFFRLRPLNFPTIRLAQLADLYSKNRNLFRSVIEARTAKELEIRFTASASEYWDSHFIFGNEASKKFQKKITTDFIHLILLNTVLPLKFLYQRITKSMEENVHIELVESIPSEKNAIISKFKNLKINSKNAMNSQALIQLKTNYCEQGKCLQCSIGRELLKN